MSLRLALLISLAGITSEASSPTGSDGPCAACQASKSGTDDMAIPLEQTLAKLFPDARIEVIPSVGKTLAVIGHVKNLQEVTAIIEIAKQFCPAGVVNGLKVEGSQQVQLKVLMAEVSRNRFQKLGLSSAGGDEEDQESHWVVTGLMKLANDGDDSRCLATSPDNNFKFGTVPNGGEIRGFLHALQEEGVARILAEPTLTTFSGRAAAMHCGGEIPIIVPGQQDTFTVEFREYGTRIECLPVVLGDGRIRVELRPEVSELDYANGVAVKGFTVPGIQQRRIDTSVELESGESFVIGGLYKSTSDSPWNKLPFVGDLPMVGPLCSLLGRNQDARELIIMVTADLVDPTHLAQQAVVPPKPVLVQVSHSEQPTDVSDDDLHKLVQLARRLGGQVIADSPEGEFVIRLPLAATQGVIQAAAETDADEPHPPAARLQPAIRCPADKGTEERPRIREIRVHVQEAAHGHPLFGVEVGSGSDASILGHIVYGDSKDEFESHEAGCCNKAGCCKKGEPPCTSDNSCCKSPHVVISGADENECDDDDAEDQMQSFLGEVLQAQAQYLEEMMKARLHHERTVMQLKTEADLALAKQEAKHAEGLMNCKLQHLAELQKAKEAVWETEHKMLAAQYRQAIEHEREIADLRSAHADELHALRIAALEAELQVARSELQWKRSEHVGQLGHGASSTGQNHGAVAQVSVTSDLPLQVEDLFSGRVRYGITGPNGKDAPNVVLNESLDTLEQVDFTVPLSSSGRSVATEIEWLRHEVARLRDLVEDLLCITPESPPSPVPQLLSDESPE